MIMQMRNWIQLGIIALVLIVGIVIKYKTSKRCKSIESIIEINDYGPGSGWKMR